MRLIQRPDFLKKILLLSHYYYPCTLTPAQRITYWAENFHKLGYFPVVVTRAWNAEIRTHHDTKLPLGSEVKIEKFSTHEVHYLPFKPGMLDWAYLNFGENWLRPLFLLVKVLDVLLIGITLRFTSFANYYPYLKNLITSQKFHRLIISGEPFYLFRIGLSLQREFQMPWITDYRDDWSTNELQMEKDGSEVRKWIAKLESSYEKKWVGSAESIVSVSKVYTQRICDFLQKPGITVENGFEESLLGLTDIELYEQFTLVYSGVLYPSQDIKPILGVLDRCNIIGKPFRLVFMGAGFDIKEKKRIEGLVPEHLRSLVEVTERFPRQEAIGILQRAHVLLGIAYGGMIGIPSSKLYEYIAIGKPVLLCPTDGDVMEEILTETGLGFFANNETEGEELILKLQQIHDEKFQLSKLRENSRTVIKKYSRFEQLKKLADRLDE